MRSLRDTGWFSLLVWIGLLAVVWTCLLPHIAARPDVAAYLKSLDEQGIDASAMFYTELDAMDPILRRLERSR